eukprot:NODE_8_length_66115_cov_0.981823.p55 type:complete len:124 gc:universal NODE_8_length_66115_cov_0.981823:64154-64525(+)
MIKKPRVSNFLIWRNFEIMSQTKLQKREITQLKKNILQSESKISEEKRLRDFTPDLINEEIQKWTNIILDVYLEIKSFLLDDQVTELKDYINRYCISNDLRLLASELGFVESENDSDRNSVVE